MEGFSEDGYIIDQDCFSDYRYRTVPASHNSCGCVAVFNLRHYRGETLDYADVLKEMERMHIFHVPGPTRMHVMREYLDKYLPGYEEIRGWDACLQHAKNSSMGILRYREEGIPHFVPYLLNEQNEFRFFNVNDTLIDGVVPMEEFMRDHCVSEPIILLCWPKA